MAYRYRVNGSRSKRPQVGGFATRAQAERALRRELERLRPGRQVMLAELVEEYLRVHQAALATIEKLRWLLAKATAAFGEVRLVDLRADEICGWRRTLPEGHRFEATQALRQVLNAAVAWQLLDVNPARRGVANPLRRFPEKRPFESWDEIRAVAAQLGPVTGPMVVFGAATGLRPAELVALEQRDVDCGGGVVFVRRQFVRGQIKQTKTRRSVRAVPLQGAALEALDQLPESDGSLLFPAARGGYLDLHNFRAREWRPAQIAARIDPIRRPYDLRHTYATFALRAGISIFDLSIHGRKPRDDRQALRPPGPRRPTARHRASRRLRTRHRRVDAKWTSGAAAETRAATATTPPLNRRGSGRWTYCGRRRAETSPC